MVALFQLLIKDKKRTAQKLLFRFHSCINKSFYRSTEKKTNKNEQIRGDDVALILVLPLLCAIKDPITQRAKNMWSGLSKVASGEKIK